MKTLSFFSLVIIVSLSACEKSGSQKPVAKTVFNEVCPISGEPVSPKSKTVEHEGKVYGFCCDSCEPKFKADPAKYSANLSADGKTFVGKPESMH
ncbi:MAG: YHS domain-containing protein [Chloroherpetonaceae bacterium]|nr:YHS domain-containing protein [Chloroherpetonaceae bacterium]MDW8437862.1 YHS domain-containing protein [Chloroherpetonaceae bacterium]